MTTIFDILVKCALNPIASTNQLTKNQITTQVPLPTADTGQNQPETTTKTQKTNINTGTLPSMPNMPLIAGMSPLVPPKFNFGNQANVNQPKQNQSVNTSIQEELQT